MKVILLQDVKGTGKKNELKEVSDGYARNFLLPKKVAVIADNTAMKELGEKKANNIHYDIGKNVREAIIKNGGTVPEKLETPNKSLKELEKDNKSML